MSPVAAGEVPAKSAFLFRNREAKPVERLRGDVTLYHRLVAIHETGRT